MIANKKILLVDDEPDIVETVSFRLEAAGYDVISAYDGKEALKKAKTENPDLIILDLTLPKMDGYKVCELIKSDVKYSKIPIILFSARTQDEDRKTGKKVGADDYIIKPFEPALLLKKISDLLEFS